MPVLSVLAANPPYNHAKTGETTGWLRNDLRLKPGKYRIAEYDDSTFIQKLEIDSSGWLTDDQDEVALLNNIKRLART